MIRMQQLAIVKCSHVGTPRASWIVFLASVRGLRLTPNQLRTSSLWEIKWNLCQKWWVPRPLGFSATKSEDWIRCYKCWSHWTPSTDCRGWAVSEPRCCLWTCRQRRYFQLQPLGVQKMVSGCKFLCLPAVRDWDWSGMSQLKVVGICAVFVSGTCYHKACRRHSHNTWVTWVCWGTVQAEVEHFFNSLGFHCH